jgi:hypothetical protein
MVDPGDWRDLEAGWQSAPLDSAFVAKVRFSMQWRIWLSRAWFTSEMLSGLLLIALIVQNLVVGRIAVAGSLTLIGAVCAAGFWWARGARLVGNMESLLGMVDLTLSRARRTLRLVFGSYAVMLLLLVAVLARRDEMFAPHLAWLIFSIAVAGVIHVWTWLRLRRFTAIRRALFGSPQ